MRRTRPRRRGPVIGVAALASLALAAGVAYATIPDSGTRLYHACMLKNVGTIRIIDPSLPSSNVLGHCISSIETAITWDEQGPKGDIGLPGETGKDGAPGLKGDPGEKGDPGTPGTDGTNVTLATEPPGTHCANGGVQLTAANGSAYVCNGADGARGLQGPPGSSFSLAGVHCPQINDTSHTQYYMWGWDSFGQLECLSDHAYTGIGGG